MTQTRDFIAGGHSQEEAIRLASIQRVRPKLMTASCAALGLVPILLTRGTGAEIEQPLAVVMIGGLVTSTLFTLLVLPAVYLLVVRLREERSSEPQPESMAAAIEVAAGCS
jgi:cobalt-zinc-cadmium resistance protein CzcA